MIEGGLSKASGQHSFSKGTSERNMHALIFPYLPAGCYFRSLLFQLFAQKCAWLVGSFCVHLVDYSARTMEFAKLKIKCREEEGEGMRLNPAVSGW